MQPEIVPKIWVFPGSEKRKMTAVGFEPTPPERLEPKSSALDHSATLPWVDSVVLKNMYKAKFW